MMTKEQAVAEVIDMIWAHGQNHAREFLDKLQNRGYKVVKIRAGDVRIEDLEA